MIGKRICCLVLCGALLGGLSASAQAVEFPDVSAEHWAYEDIQKAAGYGLIQGLEDGTFRPEERLNRASFVTILQRMFGWETVSPETPSFPDVSPSDWYYGAAETARAHGVTGDWESFQPMAYITREDMAVMLVRALGYEDLAEAVAADGCPFPDVTGYQGHISLAASFGLTTGVEVDGQLLFQPEDFATRGQAAAMLVRVYERYISRLESLNGFYAFSSYSQLSLAGEMDTVALGWSRLCWDGETGEPWVNMTSAGGNDWVRPQGYEEVLTYLDGRGVTYTLSVYADTTQDVTGSDGSASSVPETVLPDPAARAKAVAVIAAAAEGYGGVTIDFEGFRTEKLRESFVSFMQELRAALPADQTLSVCVPPDVWYQGYDYRALGEVCDLVILMAHDYQWTSVPDYMLGQVMGTSADTSSPAAPLPDIYRALASITDPETGVRDRSKVRLQISFGTAGFQVDGEDRLLSDTIYHPAPDTIAQRLRQSDTVVTYDPVSRSPMARYTGDGGERYILWYEDARSVADKLTLARMFGIGGASVWRLGIIPAYTDIPDYDVWSAIEAQR